MLLHKRLRQKAQQFAVCSRLLLLALVCSCVASVDTGAGKFRHRHLCSCISSVASFLLCSPSLLVSYTYNYGSRCNRRHKIGSCQVAVCDAAATNLHCQRYITGGSVLQQQDHRVMKETTLQLSENVAILYIPLTHRSLPSKTSDELLSSKASAHFSSIHTVEQ